MFATLILGAALKATGRAFSTVTGALVEQKERKAIQKLQKRRPLVIVEPTLALTRKESAQLEKNKTFTKGRQRAYLLNEKRKAKRRKGG